VNLRAAIDRASKAELLEAMTQIIHRLTVLDAASAAATPDDDVFLSPKELSRRIPFTVGSLTTYVYDGRLVEGLHYFKRGHRTVYSWKAMKAWITTTDKEVADQEDKLEPISTQTRRRSR
jgi:hypothetical protein